MYQLFPGLKLHVFNKMASLLLLTLLSCRFIHLGKQRIHSFGQQTPFGDVQSTVEVHGVYKYIYLCFHTRFYPEAILHWGHVFERKIFKNPGHLTNDFMVSRTPPPKFHKSLLTSTQKFSPCPKEKCTRKPRLKMKSLRTCCCHLHDNLTWMLFKICRRKF